MNRKDGPVILRLERSYVHPLDAVLAQLTERSARARWFPAPVHPELTEDTPFEPLGAADTFRWRWGTGDVLRISLRATEKGTDLELQHILGGPDPWSAGLGIGRYAAGWEGALGKLATALNGGAPRAARGTVSKSKAVQYTKRFQRSPGRLLLTPDGDLIRFDRDLLGVSPAEVWPLIYDGSLPTSAATELALKCSEVTAVRPERLLEFDADSIGHRAGSIRWELHTDPGYGAYLRLDHLVDQESLSETLMYLASWDRALTAFHLRLQGLSLGRFDPGDNYELEMLAAKYTEIYADYWPAALEEMDAAEEYSDHWPEDE